MDVWGEGLWSHLSAPARKKRKRQASKKRRARLKAEDARQMD
jgi:hypothetical protein